MGLGVCRLRLDFRRSLVVDFIVGLVLVAGHQTGRGGDLGPVLGFHFNFEIGRLVGIDLVGVDLVSVDLGDFRFRLGWRLGAGFDGSAQRIENAGIAGQGFEFLDPGAGLVRHEVVEIEADFFHRLGDLGIAGGIGIRIGFVYDGVREFRGRSGLVDRKRMLPLGGEVGRRIVPVRRRVPDVFLDGEFRMLGRGNFIVRRRGRGHRPGRGQSRRWIDNRRSDSV